MHPILFLKYGCDNQGQSFEDQQQAQESFDQGMYNLGSSLLPIHL